MATVNGNDVLLFLGDNANPTVYKPVVCLTNNTWGRTKSSTSTATKCGTFKSNGSKDYTCTATGLVIVSADSANYGHADLVSIFTDDTSHKWKISKALPVTGDEIITFEGEINALSDTFPTEGFSTFDMTITPDPTTVSETIYAPATNTLTSNTVANGNVAKSSTKNILYIGKLVNLTSQTPTAIASTLTGTWDASDLAKVELYVNGNAAIDGSEVLVQSITSTSDTAPHTYSFANSNPFTAGTHYFIVTADIASTADTGHTAIASKLTFTGLGSVPVDTQTATGGTKTVA